MQHISRSLCKECLAIVCGLCSPDGSLWSLSLQDLTVLPNHFLTRLLSLYLDFLIFLSFLSFLIHSIQSSFSFFPTKLCLWRVGKWAEQSMWGFEDHLELRDRVFVEQPAGHIKRWGRAAHRKTEQCKGKEVWAQNSGCLVFKPQWGRVVLLAGRSSIQMHSSRTGGLPFTSSAVQALCLWYG